MKIVAYTDRKEALRDAKYVINAIQVAGYKPGTVIDFEVPKRYGLAKQSLTPSELAGFSGLYAPSLSCLILQKTWRKSVPMHGF